MDGGVAERALTVAALGRPLSLGMLYDSRNEQLLSGITLWDQDTLANRTVTQHETSDFKVLFSDSIDEKSSALNVGASLKISILGGLLNLEGAGKYIDDRKTSSQQERVALQYKCTTRTESLTMATLGEGRVQHRGVFQHGTATHVVTGVTYGAQAFFVFDRHHEHSSSLTEAKGKGKVGAETNEKNVGSLATMVSKIPSIKVGGDGKLDFSDDDKKKTEEFTCRFFGDFLLHQNPYSFEDAVKLYQELPKLLGKEGNKAVPVKVDLYPLCLIDTKAAKLVRDISIRLIRETEKFFEEMHGFDLKCNDILNYDAAKRFTDIQVHIEEFQKMTETYKRIVQKELCELLPRIRGGGREETCLADMLNKVNQSPFSSRTLRSLLQAKERDIKVLSKHTRALTDVLTDIHFATDSGDFDSVVLDPDNTYCLCLTYFLPSHDSQLEAMRRHCLDTPATKTSGDEAGDAATARLTDTKFSMTEVVRAFRNFCHANSNTNGVCFIAAQEFSECNALHARVDCYEDGRRISKNYELPSAPERVQAVAEEATHDSVTVSWSPPQYGVSTITSYVVSCGRDDAQVTVGSEHNRATVPGLDANTKYEVQVWSKCRFGNGPAGEAVTVRTRPASPLEMLSTQMVSSTTVLLSWRAPACLAAGCSVEQYIVEQETRAGHWEEKGRTSPEKLAFKVTVAPNAVQSFRVAASCNPAGRSRESEPVTVDLTKSTPEDLQREDLKQYVCARSRLTASNPNIYVLELNTVSSNSVDMIDTVEFGDRKPGVPEKVIMVVGATGSGKTTLINGFVNFIFGVEWKDPFRFKMIVEPNAGNQAESQTTRITSYTLHHREGFRVPYTLTIIDTPGFGDVRGIMRDKKITENIRKFFTTRGAHNVTHIDAIGFVANSSLPRLTLTQRYVFDQILSLFGKDIAKNIFLLLTFSDGKEQQVLSAMKKADVPHEKYFKFNNSALYASQGSMESEGAHNDNSEASQGSMEREGAGNDNSEASQGSMESEGAGNDNSEASNFDTMFWEIGLQSFCSFTEQLNRLESKSLILTQDVLNYRSRLQTYVAGIQTEIREGLNILQRLEKERDLLQNHCADIDRNKNFEYEVEEEVTVQVSIPSGQYITNCLHCQRTCHEVCQIPEDSQKMRCAAMKDGKCCICPGKCVWSVHGNFPYRYVPEKKMVKKTVTELRERYESATKKKLTTKNIIDKISEEFEEKQVEVLGSADCVRMCLERLQEIALRPNPLSTVQYIETMMEAEKSQAEPGWQKRFEQLRAVKEQAEYMEKIAKEGFDPFSEYVTKMSKSKWFKDKVMTGFKNFKKYISE